MRSAKTAMLAGAAFLAADLVRRLPDEPQPEVAPPAEPPLAVAPDNPDGPPDRLSVDKDSPFFDADLITRVGVKFKGVERKNTVEYCVSERWVLLQRKDLHGRPLWRAGKHVVIKLQGDVEVRWI